MGKTSKSAWTQRERDAAALFGASRQRCSGSSGREDCSRSDSTHPTLFMEVKLRDRHTVRTLFDQVRALAKKERRTPVLMLADKSRPGMLVAFHTDDFEAIVAEYVAANASDALEGKIRRAFERVHGSLDVAQPATDAPFCITPILPSDETVDAMAGIAAMCREPGRVDRIQAKLDEWEAEGLTEPTRYRDPSAPVPPAIPWPTPPGPLPRAQHLVPVDGRRYIVGGLDGRLASERSCCGGTGRACCERAGEYNGAGSDGPPAFLCPNGCPCHD